MKFPLPDWFDSYIREYSDGISLVEYDIMHIDTDEEAYDRLARYVVQCLQAMYESNTSVIANTLYDKPLNDTDLDAVIHMIKRIHTVVMKNNNS